MPDAIGAIPQAGAVSRRFGSDQNVSRETWARGVEPKRDFARLWFCVFAIRRLP